MKLLNKTSLIIITISLFVFLGGGLLFFYSIRSLIQQETDAELISYSGTLYQEIRLFQYDPNAVFVTQNNVILREVNELKTLKPFFSDTSLYDPVLQSDMPYRVYHFGADYGAKKYDILVLRAMNNTEKLLERIVLAFTAMLILLVISLAVFNRYVFGQIWDDFFDTLSKIKDFRIKSSENIILKTSEIDEFNDLNQAIEKLIDRINLDFHNLKEFTENVSHELQTPLAIMRSKIELMLQDEKLSEHQMELAGSLFESVNRLSAMNRVLILMTRIENNQFPDTEPIQMDERIRYHLSQMAEMIESRNLRLEMKLEPVLQEMNPALADILLINLIKNAVRYNIEGGLLRIHLDTIACKIENSGRKAEFSGDDLFKRYVRSGASAESMGLGLSIVDRICNLYQMSPSYQYINDLNTIEIAWKAK